MPELPEVETLKEGLKKFLIGKVIKKITSDRPKMLIGDPKQVFGAQVKEIARYAKLLEVILDNQYSLLFHLKLTGQLVLIDDSHPKLAGGHAVPPLNTPVPNKSTHITISFEDGSRLYFNDLRQFGWLKILKTEEVAKEPFIQNLGPEPLTKDFNPSYLTEICKKTSKPIKTLLMEQDKIAGLGNIYSDEALWWAKIHPKRKANSLSLEEIEALYKGCKKAIEEGIAHKGSSLLSYVTIEGERGNFLHVAKAYQQKECSRCGGKISSLKIGGRTAHFCGNCQR
jgi:formamidopyrimidine-DNA glycosylase